MADFDGLHQVRLSPGDEQDALALSRDVGWNQLAADWTHFIQEGLTIGLRDRSGRLVATSAALPYDGPFGFVSMVIVTPAMRRRGLASALVRICADDLRARGLVPVLDATEQGQPVYEKQGFVPQFRYDRWERDGEGSMPALRPGPATDAQAIAHLDAQAFGAARPALLRAFLSRPDTVTINTDDTGFALLRRGRRAWQAGPVVSTSEDGAIHLISQLPLGDAPLFIDVPQGWQKIGAWLAARGFAVQRRFARMAFERRAPFGAPDRLFATAGPEYG